MGIGGGAKCLLRELRRRSPGDVSLQMTTPGTRALARQPVVLDHDVAELGPAPVQLPVDHDAAAAARPQRQHHDRLRPAAGARHELGIGRGVRVVLDADRKVEPLRHPAAQVEALQRDVDRAFDPTRLLVET